MSESYASIKAGGRWRRRLLSRDPTEEHRAATPLELLFDLCFVIAIAEAAAQLHHALAAIHVIEALPIYGMIFFAIWWAWMNFTWFASAYDNDDVPYRLLVLIQISGALVIAAGVKPAFHHGTFGVVTAGYAIIRISQILLWLRAARDDPDRRTALHRYALGLGVVQSGWITAAVTLGPAQWPVAAALLVVVELAVPIWAEKAGPTTWHPHHIAERYGLLTIIVLGEALLGAAMAAQYAFASGALAIDLVLFVVGALVIFFAMWWIYFDVPAADRLRTSKDAFFWGYGHLIIFASIAAVGSGIAFLAESFIDPTELEHGRLVEGVLIPEIADAHSRVGHEAYRSFSGLAVSLPAALFLASVWFVHIRPSCHGRKWSLAAASAMAFMIGASFAPSPVFVIGLVFAGFTSFSVAAKRESGGI